MSATAKATRATIIPCLCYRDAVAAIEWLSKAFGFEKQAVYPHADGTIAHAQLTFGNGMIMLGTLPKEQNEWSKHIKDPEEIGGESQAPYLIVSDADAVYARAQAAGAVVIREIKDEDYGGRGFSCRDPEGHIWHIGTYDPWS